MNKFVLPIMLALLTMAGCDRHAATKSAKTTPAKVEKLPVETEIGRITLTPEAEQRLGIRLAPLIEQDIQRRRTFGGDVMIPVGKSITVSAPFAGTVSPPREHPIPVPGQQIGTGTAVLTLVPLLTPERDVPTPAEQVQMANARATLLASIAVAQGDVQRGKAEIEAAQIVLARAGKLFADRAGAERAVDDAKALLAVAQSVTSAALDRERQLTELVKELDKPAAERKALPLDITSPRTGVLRSMPVSEGQAVTPGSVLFEVVDTGTMWIRVPIFVEILSDIDTATDASVGALGAIPTSVGSTSRDMVATPVVAPPSADALSSSLDLYYECVNQNGLLRPGQRVGMSLALRGQARGLTAPSRAIVYDIYGGSWVYIRTAEHVFQRAPVLIHYMLGDRAVLAEGPSAGTQVVTDGAAELFGTEFGAGK